MNHNTQTPVCSQPVTRRGSLTIGAFGFGGWLLADLLRAEAADPTSRAGRSIINVHLDGGPPHLDTIDPKPDAPLEIRGEFGTIETRLPGVRISELMPQTASIADRFTLIRSLVGSVGAHDAFQCLSGYGDNDLKAFGGRPAMGSVLSKLGGSHAESAPPFIDLMQGRPLVRNSARPGFLGPSYQPFRPDISHLFQRELEPGMKGELARLGADHRISLTLNPRLSLGRLQDRKALLADLDGMRRAVDQSGMMDAMDRFSQQAVGILTSGRLAAAMRLESEPPHVLARYACPQWDAAPKFETDEGPGAVRKFLLARRLIEAGARCVSLSISDFDTHSDNFSRMRRLVPIVDQGLCALVTDLEERGMLDDVTVVAWGEFGRTPRIDPKTAGRHHWPQAGPALIAGGRLKSGQVIGATDRWGSDVVSRPVTYKDVSATLYHSLGIDAKKVTIPDPQGRPQYLLDQGDVIRELV